MSKFDMLAGAEIEKQFTVGCLLDIVEKINNVCIISAAQHPSSFLKGFHKSVSRCELIITISSEPVGMNARAGNLRDWLQGEHRDHLIWIVCTENNKEWEENVTGAVLDPSYNRLLLQT